MSVNSTRQKKSWITTLVTIATLTAVTALTSSCEQLMGLLGG